MNRLLFILMFVLSFSAFPKEWQSITEFQKETNLHELPAKDWLRSDRKQSTLVWSLANHYNLSHNLTHEYETIAQRRDFYKWYYEAIALKGHEVMWPKMAHFISKKLRLIKAFPYNLFTKKEVKDYAYLGSESVFNLAFPDLKALYFSNTIFKGEAALQWDEEVLYKEQYLWINHIYETIDTKSLKTIERMAKGKGFYALMVAKAIRFEGDISKPEERFNYALGALRDYCERTYN